MRRASRAGFEAEMLCKKPNLENVVFDDFDVDSHVCELDYDPTLPLYRTLDFGFINPFVCLWIQVDGDGVIRVIDEYQRSRATIDIHAEEIKRRTLCGENAMTATFCDPAGAGVNDVTGTSAVRELRSMGVAVKYRRSKILEGVELIRRALKAGDNTSGILISNKCERLIEAMRCYHYPDCSSGLKSELPLKDGLYDHHIDALRYFFVNYARDRKIVSRMY
jgi:phage terminase large subunit